MSNSPEESSPSAPSEVSLSAQVDPTPTNTSGGDAGADVQNVLHAPAIVATPVTYMNSDNDQELRKVQRRFEQLQAAQFFAYRRRHLRTSVMLFLLTLLLSLIHI